MFNDELDKPEDNHLLLSVVRYEKMMRDDAQYFFDLADLECIIDHYHDRNDFKKAGQVIAFALSQHPNSATLYIKKAQLLLTTNQPNRSKFFLEKAAMLEPSHPDIYLVRGNICENSDRPERALEYYRKALELVEDKNHVHLHIAYLHQNVGDYDLAIPLFKEVLGNYPKDYDALQELACCYEMVDQAAEGVAYFKNYIDQYPYAYQAWHHLGALYTKLGLYEKAVCAYDYCLLIDENFSQAYVGKAQALMANEYYFEAIQSFEESFKREDSSATTFCWRAECYVKLGMVETALVFYEKALALNPECDVLFDVLFGLGVCMDMADKYPQALHYYREALEINPADFECYFAIAEISCKLSDFEAAKDAYQKIVDLNPADLDVWLDYSAMLYEQGDTMAAIDVVSEGLIYHPAFPDLHYRMVAYLLRVGKKSKAMNALEQVLLLAPDKAYLLFDYLPQLQTDKVIIDIINRYAQN